MGRHVRYRLSDIIDWETALVDDIAKSLSQSRERDRPPKKSCIRPPMAQTPEALEGASEMIPIIYDLAEAASILGFSESYLRAKLRDRTFAGMKRAGRWEMIEAQIKAAIESMCIDARPPVAIGAF
jgi:hypothetical protein